MMIRTFSLGILGMSYFFVEIHHNHKKDILLMEEAPVDMENILSFFKGFILSRWCRMSSINNTI